MTEHTELPPDPLEGEAVTFTVGEKLASLGWSLTHAQAQDAGALGQLLRMIRNAQRFGLLSKLTDQLPPLEDEDAWHELIGLVVGVLLTLRSDGVELDLEACELRGAAMLAAFQEQVGG